MKKLNLNLLLLSMTLFGFAFIASACGTKESKKVQEQEKVLSQSAINETTLNDDAGSMHDENGIRVSDEEAALILKDYLKIKEALVASDAGAASKAASAMLKNIKGIDGGKSLETFRSNIEKVANSKDIAEQRKVFSALSDPIVNLAKAHSTGLTLYKQFCPMALDGGAYWLSEKEEIMNPYYGDRMLHCGSVKEVIGKK